MVFILARNSNTGHAQGYQVYHFPFGSTDRVIDQPRHKDYPNGDEVLPFLVEVDLEFSCSVTILLLAFKITQRFNID